MTGGSITLPGGKKQVQSSVFKLNEHVWTMERLSPMNVPRNAHGITTWKSTYIIVGGSLHREKSAKKCEMYDTITDQWIMLPDMNF